MTLDALLLGLALENLGDPGPARRVRVAETALTTLHGARQMAAAAPGFVEPFDVVSACEQLAGLAPRRRLAAAAPAVRRAGPPGRQGGSPPSRWTRCAPNRPRDRRPVLTILGLHRLTRWRRRSAPATR